MHNIAVIGAGMAGCTLARRLVDGGLSVRVFDKGRAAGGRMATRAVGACRFDHGAQFMSVRGAAMSEQLADWQRAGVVSRWPQAEVGADARWVGVPGMNALAPRMLWGAELQPQTTIAGIGTDRLGWWLANDEGMIPDCFDAVLVTLPAPQAAALFDGCSGADATPFSEAMRDISYASCWALMLSFDHRLDAPDCMRLDRNGVLGWAARDSSKPQHDAASECWVVHASARWSDEHMGLEPEDVEPLLLAAFQMQLGMAVMPVHLRAHRWRYARVLKPLGRDCIWDDGQRLGYASDGCLGERVEDAFDSANALAGHVLRSTA